MANNLKMKFKSKPRFVNHIDTDILDSLATAVPTLVTDNNIKCSKSVVSNALYFLSQGKEVKFCLGAFSFPFLTAITHCWVECDGQIIHTHVPEVENMKLKTFENKSIDLVPGNLDEAKAQIKAFIEGLR